AITHDGISVAAEMAKARHNRRMGPSLFVAAEPANRHGTAMEGARLAQRRIAASRAGLPPQSRVICYLTDNRFRLPVMPKGSFFSNLRIVPKKCSLARQQRAKRAQ